MAPKKTKNSLVKAMEAVDNLLKEHPKLDKKEIDLQLKDVKKNLQAMETHEYGG